MKPEEQRIAIAEACGYKWVENVRVRSNSQSGAWCSADGWYNPKTKEISDDMCDLPNYLNDLNAMREAENKLSKDHRKQLVYVLLRVVIADLDRYTPEIDKFRVLYFATAAQRAEAFIRTIGKWNSDKINKTLE
jgi:hypothetical protein